MILRVIVKPSDPKPTQVMSKDGILDEDLNHIIVMKGEICHLKPERQHAHKYGDQKRVLMGVVDATPPSRQPPFQGSVK